MISKEDFLREMTFATLQHTTVSIIIEHDGMLGEVDYVIDAVTWDTTFTFAFGDYNKQYSPLSEDDDYPELRFANLSDLYDQTTVITTTKELKSYTGMDEYYDDINRMFDEYTDEFDGDYCYLLDI